MTHPPTAGVDSTARLEQQVEDDSGAWFDQLVNEMSQNSSAQLASSVLSASAQDVSIRRLALNDNLDGSHLVVYSRVVGFTMWRSLLHAMRGRVGEAQPRITTTIATTGNVIKPVALRLMLAPPEGLGLDSRELTSGSAASLPPIADAGPVRATDAFAHESGGVPSLPMPSGVAETDASLCRLLMRAWLALHTHGLILAHSRRALDDLARALNKRGPKEATYALLAGVLACYVWPDRFRGWREASHEINGTPARGSNGKVRRLREPGYVSSIHSLFQRLGGVEHVRDTLTPLLPSSQLAQRLMAQRASLH